MLKTLKNLLKQDREKFIVPKSVQAVIPIKTIWEDGIFLVGRNKYAKTFKFEDINYAVASREDKEAMFLEYSELLNSLDSGATTKITINNRRLNKADFEQTILIPTALPFGVRKIDAFRTLTTESLAVFIPFRVQEIYHENGVYYRQNVISKNMIIANRRHLLNGNSFILGVSGAGKSFTAKEEMTNIILTDPNADVIIIDPEREYSPLVKAMQGEVIHISATSDNHINAMDMNSDYGDGANPVILKSEFILSLCEQLIGGASLGAKQKSIIDRCTASVYRHYQQGNYMGVPPNGKLSIV